MVALYVNTNANWFLDYIGRGVDLGAPDATAKPQVELIDVHHPGLEFEFLVSLLPFLTSGDSVMESFKLPDDCFAPLTEEH